MKPLSELNVTERLEGLLKENDALFLWDGETWHLRTPPCFNPVKTADFAASSIEQAQRNAVDLLEKFGGGYDEDDYLQPYIFDRVKTYRLKKLALRDLVEELLEDDILALAEGESCYLGGGSSVKYLGNGQYAVVSRGHGDEPVELWEAIRFVIDGELAD